MKKTILSLLLMFLGYYSVSQSEQDAIKLSHAGKYQEAEATYLNIEKNGGLDSTIVTLDRAYNYSWWGKYDAAESLFKSLILKNRNNLDAIIGLAYNTSWKGERDKAVQFYQKAISIDPSNRSAWLGLAYNYLEKGNLEGTESTINKMKFDFLDDPELLQLEGLLAIKKLENRKAKKAFKKALKLDPTLNLAQEKLEQFDAIPSKWSLSFWHGSSLMAMNTKHSFRRFDFVFMPNSKVLLYGGYDNTLVLQNSFLRRQEIKAPMLFLGTKYNFTDKWSSKLEIAKRRFSDSSNQWIISAENNYFAHTNFIVSSHIFYDMRSAESLLTAGLSTDIGISRHFRTMVSYFYQKNFIHTKETNQRILLTPKLFIGNSELNIGLFYDHFTTSETTADSAGGYFLLFSVPIINNIDGKLLFHQDINQVREVSRLFSIGLTIKL
jgi:tetratricopeptide (TPR) repeat protein